MTLIGRPFIVTANPEKGEEWRRPPPIAPPEGCEPAPVKQSGTPQLVHIYQPTACDPSNINCFM